MMVWPPRYESPLRLEMALSYFAWDRMDGVGHMASCCLFVRSIMRDPLDIELDQGHKCHLATSHPNTRCNRKHLCRLIDRRY